MAEQDVVARDEPRDVVAPREMTPQEKKDEWLREAREIRDLDAKGEAASPLTIKRLMLDAIPVVEALVPPA